MANLQATKVTSSLDVQQNTYIKLGQSYVSSGGTYAHFSQNAWYNGASWQGGGGTLQITGNTLNFLKDPATSAVVPLSTNETTTTIDSTAVTIAVATGNTNTNARFGIGAAAGAGTTDGKLYVNAGNTGKPFLEVQKCLADGSNGSTFYSTFKGWLAIKINSEVGASAIPTGTWYIRLWG